MATPLELLNKPGREGLTLVYKQMYVRMNAVFKRSMNRESSPMTCNVFCRTLINFLISSKVLREEQTVAFRLSFWVIKSVLNSRLKSELGAACC